MVGMAVRDDDHGNIVGRLAPENVLQLLGNGSIAGLAFKIIAVATIDQDADRAEFDERALDILQDANVEEMIGPVSVHVFNKRIGTKRCTISHEPPTPMQQPEIA